MPDDRMQVFYPGVGNNNSTLMGWREWRKPRGINWIFILCIGAGGGGGGGFTAATASAKGGGAGGGSGTITKLMGPAFMFPDTMFVSVGDAAPGGAAGAAGTVGYGSLVSWRPAVYAPATNICIAFGGTGGAAGTAAGNVAGTAASTVQQAHIPIGITFGLAHSLGGVAGANGGTIVPANGGNISQYGSFTINGGAGGGSVSAGNVFSSGGSVFASDPFTQGTGGQNDGDPGANGYTAWYPFFHARSGAGGAGSVAGTGGLGGIGGLGCGGGGGGAGITGGKGGDGGGGLVVIGAW